MDTRDTEETSLLQESDIEGVRTLTNLEHNLSYYTLPVAFFAAFGTSSTAATTVFGYAFLCCDDPLHCNVQEHRAYAQSVALGTTIANICGALALGPVAHFSSTKCRSWGLSIWFLGRGMSVLLLLIAVAYKSMPLALVGRVFEGAATDNILHFNLNAIYVENSSERDSPRLLGLSLGFYMVGLAIGPHLTGLLKDFTWSFYLAIATFLFSLSYIRFFIPWKYQRPRKGGLPSASGPDKYLLGFKKIAWSLTNIFRLSSPFLSPLLFLSEDRLAILYGLALLSFTSGQAYFFPALLIHTSTKFGFTSQQNGWIVSLISGTTGIYLFLLLLVIPRTCIPSGFARVSTYVGRPLTWDYMLALISILAFATALFLLSVVVLPWEVYVVAVIGALGNAAPPFIKGHLNTMVHESLKAQAVSALAFCESIGSIISPIIIGTSQSLGSPGSGVPFFVASSLVISSAIFFSLVACRRISG